MRAVILCAGLGSRLGPLTHDVPKPMLPLDGRPLLAYTIDYLARSGIQDIAINLHYLPEKITDYFADGRPLGVRIHYSYEEELLGTAGALAKLSTWLASEEDVLVLYGDILTDQDISPLLDRHRREGSFATLLLHSRKRSNSIVKMDCSGRITCFKERPSERERAHLQREDDEGWVNSGVQILSREALDHIVEAKAYDLPRDVYCGATDCARLFGLPLSGYRIAVDSPDRLHDAEEAIRSGEYSL